MGIGEVDFDFDMGHCLEISGLGEGSVGFCSSNLSPFDSFD